MAKKINKLNLPAEQTSLHAKFGSSSSYSLRDLDDPTDGQTDGQTDLNSSCHADQEYIYFIWSEMTPSSVAHF